MKPTSLNIPRAAGFLILLAACWFPSKSTKAASIWVGGFGSAWNYDFNWFPAKVPGPTDDVIIQCFPPHSYPVLGPGIIQVKSLEISPSGRLSAMAGTSLVVLGNTDINGSFVPGGIDVTINGNLRGTGALDAGNSTIYIGGSMTVSTFFARSSTIVLNGSAKQDIASYTFYNLTVKNYGKGIDLLYPLVVKNTLDMVSGDIDLGGQTLVLGTSLSAPGTLSRGLGSFTGSGAFTRWFDNSPLVPWSLAGLFPIRVNGYDRSVSIAPIPMHGGTISVSYANSSGLTYFNPTFTDKNGSMVVNSRYAPKWTISTGNSFSGMSRLAISGNGVSGISNYKNLTLSLAGCSAPGNYDSATGTNANPVTNRFSLSAADLNNEFYIAGYITVSQPIPFSISTSHNGDGTSLAWNTARPDGFVRFDVERSSDGLFWTSVGSVGTGDNLQSAEAKVISVGYTGDPSGNSYSFQDRTEGLNGTMHYRIKLVKTDGEFEYSETQSVILPFTLFAYPNPVNDLLYLKWAGSDNENAEVHITDMNGRVLYDQNINGHGVMLVQININGYKPGNYIVQLVSGNQFVSKTIVKQ